MTLHPSTEIEAQLLRERDAAVARAERAEAELDAWKVAAAENAQSPIVTPADLRYRIEQQLNETLGCGQLAHRYKSERDTARHMLEAAELRCMKLDRDVAKLELEVVDTSRVAEAIIAAPVPHEQRLEAALLAAIEIAEVLARGTFISRKQADELRELRRLVPS